MNCEHTPGSGVDKKAEESWPYLGYPSVVPALIQRKTVNAKESVFSIINKTLVEMYLRRHCAPLLLWLVVTAGAPSTTSLHSFVPETLSYTPTHITTTRTMTMAPLITTTQRITVPSDTSLDVVPVIIYTEDDTKTTVNEPDNCCLQCSTKFFITVASTTTTTTVTVYSLITTSPVPSLRGTASSPTPTVQPKPEFIDAPCLCDQCSAVAQRSPCVCVKRYGCGIEPVK
ncbi:hypothetical protein Hamer_G023530 [Homarus americanus]|uniref:Uncharacterized protein n=1 Tax=Homarus americanus TaxID=6706 RepID=A0A8J5MYC7_HOMAM|nr:hypothetical protein Hamer_G023530 [Homarus americanus]